MGNNVKKILIISAVSLTVIWLIGLTVALSVGSRGATISQTQLSPTTKPTTETPVSITWYGYTAFKMTCGSKNVLIDPWITHNLQSTVKVEDTFPADLILISDGHANHVGDSITIAKRTGAKVVTTPDIAAKLIADGLPAENILFDGSGVNVGAGIQSDGIKIVMTETAHSSTDSSSTGFIIIFPGGATCYYAGETGIFSNMQVLANLYPIHVALLPIGGISTMDSYQAAKSLQLLKASKAIPMRFGTFSNLTPNADEFSKLATQAAPETEIVILKPGQSYILKPNVYR
jgi:L-ascorbate metabolism protein UlaG (beta-lactamase superfamily)